MYRFCQRLCPLRFLLSTCLYLASVTSAPQDSKVTFVQIQPLIDVQPHNSSLRESRVEKLPLVIPGSITENNELTRKYRSEEVTTEFEEPTTEISEPITEKEASQENVYIPKYSTPKASISKPRPRGISNLNYYNKANYISTTNLIEKNEKRKFKSRCRCEKIWNCPKLQITIPRCPNEYFLCCF